MNESLVSVIIPTCRRAVFYLDRAVRSVLEQTYPHIELIVVDDSPASWPGRESVRAYMEPLLSDRVRYLANERNLGGSGARNRGIAAARGEYVTFLDDDDEYRPEKVARQVRFMEEGGYDLTFSEMTMYNDRGRVVDRREYPDLKAFDSETLLRYHLTHHLTGTPTYMFRRVRLIQIGGFDDAKLGQEFFLMVKAIENGLKIGYLRRCDVNVYKHADGGITQGSGRVEGEMTIYAFKKRYYPRLTRADIRFIRFRHHAVLAVAYRKNRKPLTAAKELALAFAASPADFASQGTGFVRRIRRRD